MKIKNVSVQQSLVCGLLLGYMAFKAFAPEAALAALPWEGPLEELEESSKTNQIYLDGYICKEPVYRKTPLGREIADVLLAVNRPYGKSDYIPCICWGRNARFAGNFEVGSRCAVWGRIQSREYMKKLSDDQLEKRVAYEVSVSKMELLEEEE